MAIDQRRRQKQLARKAAKRKARLEDKRESQSGSAPLGGISGSMPERYPIHEAVIPANILEVGVGTVVLSRRAGGRLIVSVFLTDVFCLGVKDAYQAILLESEYEEMMRKLQAQFQLTRVHPACLRKLVEGAVAYARELGIPPHKDYSKTRRIFLDLDPDACPVSFEYGKDGKPFYVAGPNDSAEKRERTLRLLEKHCGSGGFHYIVSIG